MKKLNFRFIMILTCIIMIAVMLSNCKKEPQSDQHYNLDVFLWGGKSLGFLKFRQNPDPAKIIDLDIKVSNLAPNHEYLLQRAVDSINMVDGICTSNSWLTLGKGLTPQSILTDENGNGEEALWRDVSSVPSGSKFDIHFQVIDKITSDVVLMSDCYWYTVR